MIILQSKVIEEGGGGLNLNRRAQGYFILGLKGLEHATVNHSAKQFLRGMVRINHLESAWAAPKRSTMDRIDGLYRAVVGRHQFAQISLQSSNEYQHRQPHRFSR